MKYHLVDNPLTADPSDYRASTVHDETYTMDDLKEMIVHRSVGLTDSQVESVLEELVVAVVFLLKKGGKINTPLFKITPTVAGVFTDRKDGFDRARHSINLKLKPGLRLAKVSDLIEPEKINPPKSTPVVDEFVDKGSSSSDEFITPNKIARIIGSNLKFDESDPAQGIFFINTANKKEVKVDNADLLDNTGSKLSFQIPATLASAEYVVEVRSTMSGKDLRSGRSESMLVK